MFPAPSKMADDGSIKHSQIVERAGYYMKGSARYRKMFLQVFENANPIVRGLMEKGKIKVTDASKLSYLPDEAQEEIIAQVQMGGDLESLYQAYKNRDTDTDDLSVREDKSDEVRNQRETVGQETNFRNSYPGYDMVGPSDGKMPVPMEERESEPRTVEDSKKTVLIFLIIYGLGIGVALSSRRNYRRGEEHGSAKWGSVR